MEFMKNLVFLIGKMFGMTKKAASESKKAIEYTNRVMTEARELQQEAIKGHNRGVTEPINRSSPAVAKKRNV